jgi:ATP-binding cassette, subfamily C, bacterial LapB
VPARHDPACGPGRPRPMSATVERLREDLIQPDPLLDCLVEVCRLHGVAATRASLSAGLPMEGRDGLDLALAEREAAHDDTREQT